MEKGLSDIPCTVCTGKSGKNMDETAVGKRGQQFPTASPSIYTISLAFALCCFLCLDVFLS